MHLLVDVFIPACAGVRAGIEESFENERLKPLVLE